MPPKLLPQTVAQCVFTFAQRALLGEICKAMAARTAEARREGISRVGNRTTGARYECYLCLSPSLSERGLRMPTYVYVLQKAGRIFDSRLDRRRELRR